jgi:sulfite reductase alpha subunit-like flavoprotein
MDKATLALLSSKDGKEEYKLFIEEQCPNLVEILQMFPSCTPTLDQVLMHLLPITPRYYR